MVAMAFVGCEKDTNQVDLAPERGFELTVLADDVTRTAVDADLMDIVWQADDKARVYIKGTADAVAATISEEDARIASFVNSLSGVKEGEVLVQAHYPTATIYVDYDATEVSGNRTRMNYVGMNLPKDQTATTTTFDPSADLLVANNLPVTITAEDIEAGSKTVRNFRFNRMVAISRFTYVINNTELSSSEERVNSVSFEVISPDEDKFIAGNLYLQPSETGVSYIDSEQNELTDNKDYFYGNKSNKVTVTLSDQPALKDGFTAWFVTSPVTLSADDKLLFTITTTEGTVIRKTIAAVGREVSFTTAKRNEMKVTIGNENVEIEKPSSEEAYVLMTSGTLNVGDQIIIANTSAKSALSTTQNTNNRTATSVQISDDILIPTEDTQIITVEAGTTSGTFAFNVGSGYLYAASSSSNHLKTKTTLDTNGSWSVTVAANGSATVKASGSYSRNVMQYNPNNGSPLFACYASASQSPIAIYRLTTISGGGETPEEPEQLATPTEVEATASGKMVTVTWSEVDNASFYTVTCEEDGQTKKVTANTAEFTMAAYSTSYTFSVVANGDGTNYTDSAAATATVTTEADPNVGGDGEAVTATLTNTEIVAVKTSSTSYSEVTITSNSGTWTAKAVVGASFLQINSPNSSSRKGSHVKSPVFSGVISKIVIYTTNSTASGVTAYICAADYDSSMTSTGVPSGANILTSSATNQVNGTITIDNMESLNLSQFKIFASKALYIDHIEVTYQ